jgi:hypothetical protein
MLVWSSLVIKIQSLGNAEWKAGGEDAAPYKAIQSDWNLHEAKGRQLDLEE